GPVTSWGGIDTPLDAWIALKSRPTNNLRLPRSAGTFSASGLSVMAFRDGLGERRITRDSAGASVEVLCLRKELAAVPSFEFALRERITRLAGFRHAYYGRVRGSERSTEFDHALTIASDATPGIRLSALLDTAHEQRLPVDLDVALCLIRQLVPAVAILHET